MESITVTVSNAATARRISKDPGSVPGAISLRYLGGQRVQVTTGDMSATEQWCDSSSSVKSYEYA